MKLVYQTADMSRANEIISVLANSGIETTLQGVHTSSLRSPRFVNPLTVWVLKDAEAPIALQVLARFYATEAPQKTSSVGRTKPLGRFTWFVLGAVVAAAITVAAYGT